LPAASKNFLRKFAPDFLLKQRDIVLRLGPGAGRTYATLRLLDAVGMRASNRRLVPASSRSFLFVCFGNIMRSPMAEALMKQSLTEVGLEHQIKADSAGLHAVAGRLAHPLALEASADMGISLIRHRARPLTGEIVGQAECIFAMDFQNKAELLTLYPESQNKIYMLSAYAEGQWQYREIPDPYFGDLDTTRHCYRQLQICIRNLVVSTFSYLARKEEPDATQRAPQAH
jgi:protein-tyrosine phosphatase